MNDKIPINSLQATNHTMGRFSIDRDDLLTFDSTLIRLPPRQVAINTSTPQPLHDTQPGQKEMQRAKEL
jgi:hypothetical protein